jgi:hypothetical protein
MAKAPPSNSTATPTRKSPQLPPEDSIFVHYSPYYELPLSVTTSAALHAIFFALLITGAFAFFFFIRKDEPPAFTGMVEIGGGGGNPDGQGPGRGIGNPLAGPRAEAGGDKDQKPEQPTEQPKVDIQFEPVTVARESFPELKDDPSAEEVFASPTESLKKLEKLSSDTRKKLMEGLSPGKGKGGTGRGGGKDTGVGTGQGASEGPGKGGIVNEHVKRALRWTMMFNTQDGRDYKRQLADLSRSMREKTIVAIPRPDGQYLVFRNLAHEPPAGRIEDIGEIKRIFWVDEKPESIASLAEALGVRFPPPYLVVFFPEELENKLLRLELNYGNTRGRHTEDQIQETKFQIVKRGGVYEPIVVGQR